MQIALEQNLDVQVERINPQLAQARRRPPRGVWLPQLTGSLQFRNSDQVPNSFLSGANDTLTSRSFSGTAGVEQVYKSGTSLIVGWDAARSTRTTRSRASTRSFVVLQLRPRAAVAARVPHRREPRAVQDFQEEPGNHRRPAAAADRRHGARRPPRLLDAGRRRATTSASPRPRSTSHARRCATTAPASRSARWPRSTSSAPRPKWPATRRRPSSRRRRSTRRRTSCVRWCSIPSRRTSGPWISSWPTRRSCRRRGPTSMSRGR